MHCNSLQNRYLILTYFYSLLQDTKTKIKLHEIETNENQTIQLRMYDTSKETIREIAFTICTVLYYNVLESVGHEV